MRISLLYKTLSFTIFVFFCIPTYASEFDVELALLTKKIGLCETSIVTKKCSNTEYCQDLDNYADYLFKDSATTYMNYNLKTGDLNNRNINTFNSDLKRYSDIRKLGKVECN